MKNKFYILLIFSLLVALTACGNVDVDSDGTDTTTEESTETAEDTQSELVETVDNTSANGDSSSLKIIGKITYDRVGVNSNGVGLNYNSTSKEPAKQVVVKAIDSTGKVIATATTDNSGDYSLINLPENREIKVRVYAELNKSGSGGWDVKIVDNTNGDSQYVIEGSLVSTGSSSTRRNIHASSGWSGSSYSKTRDAAPFAILGSIYQAIEKVLDADSSTAFPSLVVNWSKNNIAASGSLNDGQIVTSHYNFDDNALYILGDANSDTDEYDDHIIIHEWGHYFEAMFSRADSIGGSHSDGDRLDIRVAFGEGWGNAWSAIATDNTLYFDTMGSRQARGWSMDIEGGRHTSHGWYSEASIQEILYDLYDSNDDDSDRISLGFRPIYDVLVGSQKTTPAFTSIFSFIKGLKDKNPTESTNIDTLLEGEGIALVDDIYGSNHYSLYSDMEQGSTGQLCTSSEYGFYNKLNTHKYMRFSILVGSNYKISVKQNNGRRADPDFTLYRTAPFTNMGSAEAVIKVIEDRTYRGLTAGDYILDVSDYNNQPSACFDITIN